MMKALYQKRQGIGNFRVSERQEHLLGISLLGSLSEELSSTKTMQDFIRQVMNLPSGLADILHAEDSIHVLVKEFLVVKDQLLDVSIRLLDADNEMHSVLHSKQAVSNALSCKVKLLERVLSHFTLRLCGW